MRFARGGMMLGTLRIGTVACGLAVLPVAATAADMVAAAPPNPDAPDLTAIVVTATRVAQPSFDLPIAIDSISRDTIQDGQLQVNISEDLARLPGVVAHNRQNYAQDLQISARGFGSRSTFGVRGLRIYVDGIPATQPDGQGQVSNVDLGSAQRIEVLRGPFSVLYGNAAGGVISVFTEDATSDSAEASVLYGSFDTRRQGLKLSGVADDLNVIIDGTEFHTGGYRHHSTADRRNFNSKWRVDLGDRSTLTFLANDVDIKAQDPLGLTRAQFAADPRQAGTNAVAFNSRKLVNQSQFGLVLHSDVTEADAFDGTIYGGTRGVTQFQALPISSQTPAGSAGGVIDLDNGFGGLDLHGSDRRSIWGMPTQVTAGVAYDRLVQGRKGYESFLGNLLGIRGALRRNETDEVHDFDQYIQAQLEPGTDWLIEAGVRHSRVDVTSRDHYIAPGNGDDSGAAHYEAITPAAGITYHALPSLNLYAAYGRGFQTPTLDELAYRSTNGSATGLNFGLRPSLSDNYEIGAKAAVDSHVKATLSVFHIDSTDELAVQSNTAGRSVYQNVGPASRDGIELSAEGRWPNGLGFALSYTFLRALRLQAFTTCSTLPCVPVHIPAGSRIPGVPRHEAFAEASWRDPASGFSTALEARAESKLYVDDANSDATQFYVVTDFHAGFQQDWGAWTAKEFGRLDNLTDRKYAGSVIVNESNGRFFEPAPGRAAYFGASLRFGW